METIIGLLFILLPVIFKLIGKRLEQSGKTESAEKMREIAEKFGEDDNTFPDWLNEGDLHEESAPIAVPEVKIPASEVKAPAPVMHEVNFVEAPKMVQRKKRTPILNEEVAERKREKIDPKKLVVYSEIMNPKYKD